MNKQRIINCIDSLIKARNEAYNAQQFYADANVGVGAESLGKLGRETRQQVSDALYEATYELIHSIDNLIDSAEFKIMLLGIGGEAGK